MSGDDWSRTVHVTNRDLHDGDWDSRDRNPIALAIARVLHPEVTLYVDVGPEEYYLARGGHREWLLLPEEFRFYANRVCLDDSNEELSIVMRFPPWALLTKRSVRKQKRRRPDGNG